MAETPEILTTIMARREKLQELGVCRLGIFGSHARGDARPDSDVDVLVELDVRTFDRYMDVKHYLEDLLGKRVDLVLADRIKPRLRDRILSEVVYAA